MDAVRVVDPTMLRKPDDYRALWNGTASSMPATGLAVYLLDDSVAKRRVVDEVASIIGGPRQELFIPSPPNLRALRRDRHSYMRPTVERWLAAMDTSSGVVTDSFHGAVFAILFNRPFLVFSNARRGAARFDTLLSVFELGDRLALGDGYDAARMQRSIDWDRVNARVVEEREAGIDFLRRSMGVGF